MCVWGGGGGGGAGVGVGEGRGDSLISNCVGGDPLISNCIEKSSQYVFSFRSVLNTVLCGVVASPTNGLGFKSHW